MKSLCDNHLWVLTVECYKVQILVTKVLTHKVYLKSESESESYVTCKECYM